MKNTALVKSTSDKVPIAAGQVQDANSRTIFGNALLTCQFLKNYTNLPIFADVRPEDIEDVTDHYRAFLGIEFETDTVKKVRVTIEGKQQEVYVIPLIEHKSYVDYDVAMQIFRYMAVIWYDYAKEQNALHKDISHTKQFRYPLIVPIVYYEGARRWTADFHLKDRIENADQMNGYVPDFTYYLVNCRDYTKEELENRRDEMSLVMLINRIQNPGDYSEFLKASGGYVSSVYEKAPEEIRQVISDIIWSLMMKMNVPVEEAREAIRKLEAGGMGYLFEHAEKMDIQAERQNTKEAREAAKAAEDGKRAAETKAAIAEERARTAEAKVKITEEEKKAAEAKATIAEAGKRAAEEKVQDLESLVDHVLKNLILQRKASGCTKEEMQRELQTIYGLEESTAEEKTEKYWE